MRYKRTKRGAALVVTLFVEQTVEGDDTVIVGRLDLVTSKGTEKKAGERESERSKRPRFTFHPLSNVISALTSTLTG